MWGCLKRLTKGCSKDDSTLQLPLTHSNHNSGGRQTEIKGKGTEINDFENVANSNVFFQLNFEF